MPAPAMGYAMPVQHGVPEGLKITAIILSVLKFIPIAIGLVLLFTAADFIRDLGLGNDEVDNAVTAFVLIAGVIFAIGAALLFFQIRSVVKAELLTLIVISGILSVIDLLWVASALFGDPASLGGLVVFGLTLAAQATVFVWALNLRSQSKVSGVPPQY